MPYQKVCKLQSGSFSTVYKGVLTENDQILVALKCCYKPLLTPQQQQEQDPQVLMKYQNKMKRVYKLVNNEYEILNKLRQGLTVDYFNNGSSDKHICHMVDFLESAEFYIFVLQFCEFGDLYDHIKLLRQQQQAPTNPRQRPLKYFQVLNQINSALQYSHSLGIAHRDIKPENILLDSNLNVKLTDWGLSTFNDFSLQQCIGTEKYLAPECFYPHCILKESEETMDSIPNYITHQKINDPSLLTEKGYDTQKSDIWSLGITCLYILFASCPFKFAAIQHPTVMKKFRNLSKDEQMATSLPENKNFQLYLSSPITFVEEYYFQTLLKQDSLRISKNTIHAAMNIQDDFHYPAFWLTMLPSVDDIIKGSNLSVSEKIVSILDYTLNILERDISFRLWLLHQMSSLITKSLMNVDYLKRDLDFFIKNINNIFQIQVVVLREFVRQLLELPLEVLTIESIDLTQIIHNIIHIYNNQHIYSNNNPHNFDAYSEKSSDEEFVESESNLDGRQFSIPANKNTRGFSNMTFNESVSYQQPNNYYAPAFSASSHFTDNGLQASKMPADNIESGTLNSKLGSDNVSTNTSSLPPAVTNEHIDSNNLAIDMSLKNGFQGLNIV